jgi:hypothetical protein
MKRWICVWSLVGVGQSAGERHLGALLKDGFHEHMSGVIGYVLSDGYNVVFGYLLIA